MTTVNGVNSVSRPGETGWKVGLINSAKHYLTAESFGCKINVTGTALKKKQTFVLVQDSKRDTVIYIKSHLNRFVSADRHGNVKCEVSAEEIDEDPTAEFEVEYAKDNSGLWAFRNRTHGTYLSGDMENIKCSSKTLSHQELWVVQLSIHPQVHLRNVNRKRYAHVNQEEIQGTQTIPWGEKSLFFLDFVDGKYALKTFDKRYLHTNGELSDQLSDTAKFTLEIKSGQCGGLAFRDCAGCYLTGVGPTAMMKGRNKTMGKDELFTLEDTHPQVVIYAFNDKKVSIKQGVDVSANQDEEETEKEIFQMEYDRVSGKWAFRTSENKYWVLEQFGGIQGNGSRVSDMALFDLEWDETDCSVSLKANNNQYVFNKQTGSLYAVTEAGSDNRKFRLKVVNRPMLVLKSDHGFVGLGKAETVCCNRSVYEVTYLEHSREPKQEGLYLLKAANGKYWRVDDDGSIKADGAGSSKFCLQWRSTCLTIRAENRYVKGEQNGLFRAVSQSLEDPGVFWEF